MEDDEKPVNNLSPVLEDYFWKQLKVQLSILQVNSLNFLITLFWLEPTFRAVQLGFEDRAVVGEASGPGGCSVGTGSPS